MTQKVFEVCGTPRLGRRTAQSSQFVFEKRLEKIHRTPSRPTKSEFEIMLMELKKQLKGVEGFWALLPYQMCDTQVEKPMKKQRRDRERCWNGRDVGAYSQKVQEDGLLQQAANPEVRVVDHLYRAPLLLEQQDKLQSLAGQLRSAYRGLDIEWWDEAGLETTAGSGGGTTNICDDEDYCEGASGDGVEGSGGEEEYDDYEEEELVVPTWHKDRTPRPWDPFHRRTSERPRLAEEKSTTRRPAVTGGASPRTKSSVYRVVTTFLLPVVTCYLGSFYSSLPLLFS